MRTVSYLSTGERRTISSSTSKARSDAIIYGLCEIDNYADTIVAGSNYIVLSFTGQECNVTPYRDDYESVYNVPIANVATAWQCLNTGQMSPT